MKRTWCKPLIFVFIVGSLFTCIDPYSSNVGKFQSSLVVDALLTDENKSNCVSISRTKKLADEDAEMVSGAMVIVKDDLGNSTALSETSKGIYKTDSLIFRGEVGRSYKLQIKTDDGDEYESESCMMFPVQDIDKIYFNKDREILDNETREGITIYVDSKGESAGNYYRWTYEEWWKIHSLYPKKYDYIDENTFPEYLPLKEYCWGYRKSDEIIIKSAEAQFSHPILFIASEKSPRLLVQYCINVRQLSLSEEEYAFWNQMKQIGESGGDIFDKQPFQISGNIHNINDPDERVLGYFQVSGAKLKRRYITYKEVSMSGIPRYQYPCNVFMVGPDDFPDSPITLTFDEIYRRYTNSNCIFVEPYFDHGALKKLIFVTPLCADCTLSGSMTKPDFWIDIE